MTGPRLTLAAWRALGCIAGDGIGATLWPGGECPCTEATELELTAAGMYDPHAPGATTDGYIAIGRLHHALDALTVPPNP